MVASANPDGLAHSVTTRKESWVPNLHFSSNPLLTCGSRWIFGFSTLLAITLGCGSGSQRLTQLQNENDRLMSEYRAQRDQVSQLNEKLAISQNRLAESEKLLARQSPMPSSRLSRLNDSSSLPASVPSFGAQSLGKPSGIAAGGSAKSAADSRASSGGNPSVNSNSASELYWRPMHRDAP